MYYMRGHTVYEDNFWSLNVGLDELGPHMKSGLRPRQMSRHTVQFSADYY